MRSRASRRFDGFGLGVAVGFLVAQPLPGDGRELAGRGDTRNVAVFLVRQSAEECAERARVFVEVLRCLGQEPASVRVALLGEATVIATIARLVSERHQAEGGSSVIRIGKTLNIAPGGEQSDSDHGVDAGQSHQQAHLLLAIGQRRDAGIEIGDLSLGQREQSQVAVEEEAAVLVECDLAQPGEPPVAEKTRSRYRDQALIEGRVRPILDRRAIGDQRSMAVSQAASEASQGPAARLPADSGNATGWRAPWRRSCRS